MQKKHQMAHTYGQWVSNVFETVISSESKKKSLEKINAFNSFNVLVT
jgi:hypothetical protein